MRANRPKRYFESYQYARIRLRKPTIFLSLIVGLCIIIVLSMFMSNNTVDHEQFTQDIEALTQSFPWKSSPSMYRNSLY